MDSVEIRPAIATDVPQLADLYYQTVQTLGPQHYTPAQVAAWSAFSLDLPAFAPFILDATTYVAEIAIASAPQRSPQLLGFAGIAQDGHVTALYVRPEVGRCGLGSRLLQAVIDCSQTKGIERLYAEASRFSLPLFEKFGFVQYDTETVIRAGETFERYLVERVSQGSTAIELTVESTPNSDC
jgi:putative acetyltransferase